MNEMSIIPQNETKAIAETVESQRSIAEVQAAIVLAKKFPRNKVAAIDEIINDCGRESLAECAIYSYTKGGSDVSGPSIRLAEAIAQSWGNIQFEWKELIRNNGSSECEATAWDMEKNTKKTIRFTVKHTRNTKAKGTFILTDERDIYELIANQASRRLRNCILSIIPGDVVETAVKECEKTLSTKFKATPEKVANMVKMFETFGVVKEQIEKRIGKRVEAITGSQMIQLTKVYNSLKDNMSKPADWFEPIAVEAKEVKDEKKSKIEALKDAGMPE